VAGERLRFPDRESARTALAALAAEPGNREVLREAAQQAGGGAPSGFGGRPDEGAWAPLTEALARGGLTLVRLIDHRVGPVPITTTGKLTLSDASWGETAGIYPARENLDRPDRWDPIKLADLLRARAALADVAVRNRELRRAHPGPGAADQLLRPYHCIENFPARDHVIDDEVRWFHVSASPRTPVSHPAAAQTVIAVTYGPFYNRGSGDAEQGQCYLHFYRRDASGAR
jgi:hypothetical protein